MKTRFLGNRRLMAFTLLSAVLVLFLFPECSGVEQGSFQPGQPVGQIIGASSCKALSSEEAFDHQNAGQECLAYEYDGKGLLTLRHINSSLNCCPGTITADIRIEGSTITVIECEGHDAKICRCMCLYDIDYSFDDIDPGDYSITVISSGSEELDPLKLDVSLSGATSGRDCIQRSAYPWY